LLVEYYWGEEIKEDELCRACCTHGEETYLQGFGWGILKERDHLEDVDICGRITLKWIYKLAGMALD
jgi:hypothetical protein